MPSETAWCNPDVSLTAPLISRERKLRPSKPHLEVGGILDAQKAQSVDIICTTPSQYIPRQESIQKPFHQCGPGKLCPECGPNVPRYVSPIENPSANFIETLSDP